MFNVVKRNGEVAEFNLSKIRNAIEKAFVATATSVSPDILDLLVLRVSADFQQGIKDGKITVEEIQDSVERVLEKSGYDVVAKAYILYRKKREELRDMKEIIEGAGAATQEEFEKRIDSVIDIVSKQLREQIVNYYKEHAGE